MAEKAPAIPKTGEFEEGHPFLGYGIFGSQVHGDKIPGIDPLGKFGIRSLHGIPEVAIQDKGLDVLGDVKAGGEDIGSPAGDVGAQTAGTQAAQAAAGKGGREEKGYGGSGFGFFQQAIFKGQIYIAEASRTGGTLPTRPRFIQIIGPVMNVGNNYENFQVVDEAVSEFPGHAKRFEVPPCGHPLPVLVEGRSQKAHAESGLYGELALVNGNRSVG